MPDAASALRPAADSTAAALPDAGTTGRYLGTLRSQMATRRLVADADAAAAQQARDALRAANPWREFAHRLVQCLRLMVGVHDYDQYLAHMRLNHPDTDPLTRDAFYRRCVDARYGSGSGKAGRCPC